MTRDLVQTTMEYREIQELSWSAVRQSASKTVLHWISLFGELVGG
jgi:hypothetical protein